MDNQQQMALYERRWKLSRMHGLLAYFQWKFVSWKFERSDENVCFGMRHMQRGYKMSVSFVPNSKELLVFCHYPEGDKFTHQYNLRVSGERRNADVYEEVIGRLLPDYVREFDRKYGKPKPANQAIERVMLDLKRVMLDLKLARSHLRMLESRTGVGSRTLNKVRSAIKSFEGAVRHWRGLNDR